MSTRTITYVGGLGCGVDTEYGHVDNGGDLEVPSEVAGRPPKGKPEDDDYDPGEGFLAQHNAWRPAGASTPTVGEVLISVGDDKAKAATALAAERERGTDARKTLIAQLEATIEKETT